MYKQPRTAILKPFYIQKKGSHTFSDYPSLFCHADVLSSASVIHFKWITTNCRNGYHLHRLPYHFHKHRLHSLNLANLIYNYLTICKWVVYEFCFWNKKQIRNKNGFLGKSSFFCLHYFSFLSLACNQSTNPSYYNAFSSWFNICFFIYPGIRSEKRKVLFSMIDINMCKVKNNHPSNQIFVYF